MDFDLPFLHLTFSWVQGENTFYPREDRTDNLNHYLLKDYGCTKQKLPIESKSPNEKYFSSVDNMMIPPTFYQLASGIEEKSESNGKNYKEEFQDIFT